VSSLKKTRQTKLAVTLTVALMLAASVLVGCFVPQVSAQTSLSFTINSGAQYTNSTTVTLTLSSSNATEMCFSNDNSTWSDWENFTSSKNWTLPSDDGNYTVSTLFKDSENNTLIAYACIYLDATPPVPEAYAEWYSNDYRTVYFDAYYSTDNVGIANYTWNFGDGNITTAKTVIHTYTAAGNYSASLKVMDYAGNTAIQNFSITIPDLTATATATPTPTVTVRPTTIPTSNPTQTPQPTQQPGLDATTETMILIAAVVAVGIVLAVVVVVFWQRWKTAPPQPTTVS